MGILNLFKKNKFEKLKREEVADAIIKLEKERDAAENRLENYQEQIDELLNKGRACKDKQMQLLYAKKINDAKERRQNDYNRILFLMYNSRLLEKLKQSIDDNTFFSDVGGMELNKLLADQKGLSQFLNKALGRKTKLEDIMTQADEVFVDVARAYDPNEKIYGMSESDNELLAMFETNDSLTDEMEIGKIEEGKQKNKNKEG